MEGVIQPLPGRVAAMSLLPFSIGESLGYGDRQTTLDNIIQHIFGEADLSNKNRPSDRLPLMTLIDEDLGLGWDPDWEEGRKEKIASIFRGEGARLRAARSG